MSAASELMEHESKSVLCNLHPVKYLSVHSRDLTLLFPLSQFGF